MLSFKEYIKNNIVITDGAMGTYYSSISGTPTTLSEEASITNPQLVLQIHREYVDSGATLLRTNTFSSNDYFLKDIDLQEQIKKSFYLARQASNNKAYVGGSIGPIPDGEDIDPLVMWKKVVDLFLNENCDIFIFETLSSTDNLEEIILYIKEKNKNAYIITNFVMQVDGTTRKGIDFSTIVKEVKNLKVDSYGINCGIGPFHSKKIIENIQFEDDTVGVMPNAGYPEIVNSRTIYSANPDYFSDVILEIKKLGVKIIGGCCGTTPEYIRKINQKINNTSNIKVNTIEKNNIIKPTVKENIINIETNNFKNKVEKGDFVIAVELGAPTSYNTSKFLDCGKIIKEAGGDIITVADNPLCRPHMDSIIATTKLKREIGIDVMPHICCRDRNVIGIKSSVLGGYSEKIRNLLLVTGDGIPSQDRAEIKSVFNLNSYKLMELVREINREKFSDDPIFYGGALSLNTKNLDNVLSRIDKKIKAGCSYFLTQPIFNYEDIEFLQKIKDTFDIKILGGIMPIVSIKNALFLDNEFPGININKDVIHKFHNKMSREEAEDVGVSIATNYGKEVKKVVDGLYITTPFLRGTMVSKVIRGVIND